MKRLFILAAALLAAMPCLSAQPKTTDELRAEFRADPNKYGGVYYVDDFSDRDLTPAPKGYKPFYISAYIRHGARYILYEKQYDHIWKALSGARKAGNLTPFGEEICTRFEEAYKQLKGRGGDLSPIGSAQQKAMGRRMIANYPEVFKGAATVHAFSTDVPRTALSMTYFLEGLRESNTKLQFHPSISYAEKHFLNPHSSDHLKVDKWFWSDVRAADAPWRKSYAEWFREKVDPEAILGRLFMDPSKVTKHAQSLTADLFALATDMQCVPVDASFWDLFTEEERFALWELDNYIYYAEKGPDPCNFKHGYSVSGYMLDDILTRAEKDIASGAVQADLRFGHDGCLRGLLTVMNIGDWQRIVPRDSVKNYWQVQDIPMAANLQLVFYRNRAGDILLKPLLNEKNLKLPFPAVQEPYYRWSDFLSYYRPRADEAIRIVEGGAPVNLSGTVFADGKPLSGVAVSDGIQVVRTDAGGRYRMYTDKRQGFVFVITPSGYVAGSEDGIRADFYAPLTKDMYTPEEHDFQLHSEDQSRYTVAFLTDVHLSNDPNRGDIGTFHETVMPFLRKEIAARKAEGPVYTMNLGDFTHELFWGLYGYGLEDGYKTFLGEQYPTLMYSVPGNHDNDPSVVGKDVDRRAESIYRRIFGPTCYSLNIGKEHWVMLDNIIYVNVEGKGKKAPGVKGDRSYVHGFSEDAMAFLRADLATLPDDARVILCTHCPIIKSDGSTYLRPQSQAAELDSLFARFGGVTAYGGHVHRMLFPESPDYPHIRQVWLPATSGNMWVTRPNPLLAGDGEDAGALFVRFGAGAPEEEYRTALYGERVMRIYDMNTVRDWFAGDAAFRRELDLCGERTDYADPAYRNCIYVNYWMFQPGETVEILEKGKPLPVERVTDEDPLFDLGFCPQWQGVEGAKLFVSHKARSSRHMFRAKARTARGEITVRVLDADGKVIRTETMVRPRPFSPESDIWK